jgi:hypothetical protein
LDFGPNITSTAKDDVETGFDIKGANLVAVNGDVYLKYEDNGLKLQSTASDGFLKINSSIYCATTGKALVFPKAAGGLYPLKIAIHKTADTIDCFFEISSSGGAKITVPNNAASGIKFGTSQITSTGSGKLTSIKVEATDSGGTVDFTKYPGNMITITKSVAEFDLGGNSTQRVGRIILKKTEDQSKTAGGISANTMVKTGNTAGGDATYVFNVIPEMPKSVTYPYAIKGTNPNGQGYLAEITPASTEVNKDYADITYGNDTSKPDFIIDSTTPVTGSN